MFGECISWHFGHILLLMEVHNVNVKITAQSLPVNMSPYINEIYIYIYIMLVILTYRNVYFY